MSISVISRNQQLVNYIASTTHRIHPPDVIDAAKRALVDFLAVAVGATGHACVKPVRATVMQWNAQGGARLFLGPQTTPSLAAFANGTMAMVPLAKAAKDGVVCGPKKSRAPP